MKSYLERWGLYEVDFNKSFDKLELSESIKSHLQKYIDSFPSPQGITFLGNPRITTQAMSRTVKEIYDRHKIRNRIRVVDVPTHLTNWSNRDQDQEDALIRDVINSDIVIFQEIALTQWTNLQQAKLYTLLHERYSRGVPFFCTVSCDIDDLESYIGSSIFFRITDNSTFLEL